MRELINWLNARTKEYDEGRPSVSDVEWDNKYFELVKMEKESGIYYPDSPTQHISYQVVNKLDKVEHNHPMLSLDKTKSLEEVKDFLDEQPYIAMCKMDGLTCSLLYEDGRLVSAETRGNGIVGENITHNAKIINSIPQEIPCKERLVIDGEIICDRVTFEEFKDEFKNPRNFAAGSIRLLDSAECARRKLTFVAWEVIEGLEELELLSVKLNRLSDYGFKVVPFITEIADNLIAIQEDIENMANLFFYPIDGIVFKFNNCEYGKTLGQTAHHFKNAIAYKFADELYNTKLVDIDWTMGRTGVLSPVAIFEPIDMDGSTVERANLFNLSVLRETLGEAYRGQPLRIYKANMIIPQVHDADKPSINPAEDIALYPPETCPICGGRTVEKSDGNSSFLYCDNPSCEGKLINRLDHFCGKKGLDIKGLSKATLEKLIAWGWVSNYIDLFNLKPHQKEWMLKPGFGEKSVNKILETIEERRMHCTLNSFIAALGIPLIGATVAKDLVKYFPSWEEFVNAAEGDYNFWELSNFGPEMNASLHNFDYNEAKELYNNYIVIETTSISNIASHSLEGMTFVITGKLKTFKNRDELKKQIEDAGGKVVGSISSKTSYLVNNDIDSTSAKNLAAKKNNIPIISEMQVLEMLGN